MGKSWRHGEWGGLHPTKRTSTHIIDIEANKFGKCRDRDTNDVGLGSTK